MLNKAKIIIAEDENIIAKDISKTLERLGYDVIATVRSGEAIIQKAESLKPDLVMMDIVLDGEMSGIEAAEKIMNTFNIPVIYLTALADNETLQRAKITEPFGYVLKPFDERSLHSSIEMALYKHKINFQLKERTRELEEERNKSNLLLHNIFPKEIVKELKENGRIKPREYKSVSILFTDFQDFTSLSSSMHPQELVNELNEIFKNFDAIIERYGLEKLKTMGDAYMVASGLPVEINNHADILVAAALEMQEYLKLRNMNSKYKWVMRAGIHSGNVVAGVVGKRKYIYEVWGKTVSMANVMERQGKPGRINITETTYEFLKDLFDVEDHGNINIAGSGPVKMYLVKSRKKNPVEIAENVQ